jgi:hypothetical protein
MLLENCKITTQVVSSQSNAKDLSTPQANIVEKFERTYDNGTAADQAQIVFADERTVSGSGTDNLDLAGVLVHELGGVITFTAIKEILIVGDDANTGNLRVGKGITNAFAGPFGASAIGNLVEPGGIFHNATRTAAGWAVTAGTGDQLSIENLGGSAATYKIIIIGEGSVA